jgi:hypothetical protein
VGGVGDEGGAGHHSGDAGRRMEFVGGDESVRYRVCGKCVREPVRMCVGCRAVVSVSARVVCVRVWRARGRLDKTGVAPGPPPTCSAHSAPVPHLFVHQGLQPLALLLQALLLLLGSLHGQLQGHEAGLGRGQLLPKGRQLLARFAQALTTGKELIWMRGMGTENGACG